jgi:hypothetical protein
MKMYSIKKNENTEKSKFTKEKIIELLYYVEKNQCTYKELSIKYNVSSSTIRQIFGNKTWKWVTKNFDLSKIKKNIKIR